MAKVKRARLSKAPVNHLNLPGVKDSIAPAKENSRAATEKVSLGTDSKR